jgi:hypothetical protein
VEPTGVTEATNDSNLDRLNTISTLVSRTTEGSATMSRQVVNVLGMKRLAPKYENVQIVSYGDRVEHLNYQIHL